MLGTLHRPEDEVGPGRAEDSRPHTHATTGMSPLDDPAFTTEQCDALFAAVLVHDDIHPDAELPAAIKLDYSQHQLTQCYRICRQIWKQGVDRATLSRLIEKVGRQHGLDAGDQLAFKKIRAKFKHLRFAYAAFDARHRYPTTLHGLIALMGYLQDALKNGRVAAVKRSARLLHLLLKPWPYALLTRSIDRFQPSTAQAFRTDVYRQIQFVKTSLAEAEITSRAFHEVRIAISRQVAIYDCLKILYPTPEHRAISQYLSTINGLMGSLHDELIAKKFNKTLNYHADTFAMPADIKQRLSNWVGAYGSAVEATRG